MPAGLFCVLWGFFLTPSHPREGLWVPVSVTLCCRDALGPWHCARGLGSFALGCCSLAWCPPGPSNLRSGGSKPDLESPSSRRQEHDLRPSLFSAPVLLQAENFTALKLFIDIGFFFKTKWLVKKGNNWSSAGCWLGRDEGCSGLIQLLLVFPSTCMEQQRNTHLFDPFSLHPQGCLCFPKRSKFSCLNTCGDRAGREGFQPWLT